MIYQSIPGQNFLWDANIIREQEALIMQSGKPQAYPPRGSITTEGTSIILSIGWITELTAIQLFREFPCPESILRKWSWTELAHREIIIRTLILMQRLWNIS